MSSNLRCLDLKLLRLIVAKNLSPRWLPDSDKDFSFSSVHKDWRILMAAWSPRRFCDRSIMSRFCPLFCIVLLMMQEKFKLAWKKGFVRLKFSSCNPLLDPNPSSNCYKLIPPIGLPPTSNLANGYRNLSNSNDDDLPKLKHSIPLCLKRLYLSTLYFFSTMICLVPTI